MRIAHIVNPVNVTEQSDLFVAQPVTFETMRQSKNFVKNTKLDVELFFTCYEEDLSVAPQGFTQTKLLDKSILDYQDFTKKRKLPLIKDILNRLYEVSDADYFIYTNVDIALMPHFYMEVKNIIDNGYDGFVINRRTIDGKYVSVNEIPEMYSDIGEKHPGYDCFVFKREVYPNYQLGTACIGANWIGRVIISNVIAHATKFEVFEDKHLTFHIGDDRSWKISDFNAYDKNNEDALIELMNTLNVKGLVRHDLLQLFIKQHKIDIDEKSSIIDQHKVTHTLPYALEKLYFDGYKPSKSWDQANLLSQNPIFIVGYPRSGTTLFQSLLATQSNLVSLPETHFFNWVRNNLQVKNDIIENSDLRKLIQVIRERIILSTNAEEQILNLANNKQLSPKMLFEIIVVDNLISNVKDIHDLSQKTWIEKTPDHVLYLNVILQYYPNAKFVYMLRSPEQAIISRKKNFSNEANWNILQHINAWKKNITAYKHFQQKHPDKIMLLKLEDLTHDTATSMQNVCKFLDVEFNKEKLNNYQNIAKQVSLPSEIWKKDVKDKNISNRISKNDKKLNLQDRLTLINSLKTQLVEYGYFNDEYKAVASESCITQKETKRIFSDHGILNAFEELCSFSILKQPIQKYRAYKKLLEIYHRVK